MTYVIDAEARREVRDRLGSGYDRIERTRVPEGVEIGTEAEPFIEALWESWTQITFTLVVYGFTQRSLCDAVTEMDAFKQQAGEPLVAH